MIRDRIVIGIRDNGVRKRLLREADLTLDQAVTIIRASEQATDQMRQMDGEVEQVHAVKHKKADDKQAEKLISCKYCGKKHKIGAKHCPAYGKECLNCKKKNHFAKVCTNKERKASKQESRRKEQKNRVHLVEESGNSDEESEGSVFTVVTKKSKYEVEAAVRVKLKKSKWASQRFQLDCGATVNCLLFEHFNKILEAGNEKPQLEPSNLTLRVYDGGKIHPHGKIRLLMKINGKSADVMFHVVSGAQDSVLSGETCEEFGLVKVNKDLLVNSIQLVKPLTKEDIWREYKDVFTGLGDIGEYKIKLDEKAKPTQDAPRNVPVALRSDVKKKLDQMEKSGHIMKVTEPTEWISSAVYVKKPNKLRICLDPKELNKHVQIPKYRLPTLDDITPHLAKVQVFSTLDAKDGFLQIRLDNESQKLTTFHTPFGRYMWKRLPFGISSAPEEFQRRTLEIIDDLEGVYAKADDLICTGAGETFEEAVENHDKNLKSLLERCRERNFKLNWEKFRFRKKEVTYHGHLLTSEGIKPDPVKVSAVKEMPRPKNKTEVKRFLGMVNYLGKFCPHLSEVSEPLRSVTKEDVPFIWTSVQDKAFLRIKLLMSDAPILKYYDVNSEVTVEADASDYGLGAVLLQNGQPVCYASRVMTQTERNYSQMEKECLALTFACSRFNDYLQGRQEITALTDHKSLENIFKKNINQSPKRLQRMRLRLQKYKLKVKYQSGAKMHISDHLSRSIPPTSEKVKEEAVDYEIFLLQEEERFGSEIEAILLADYTNVSNDTLDSVAQATANDEHLQELMVFILEGFPKDKTKLPEHLKQYWPYRNELACQNGICYRGTCIIIPKYLQSEILEKLHRSHLGFESTLRKAKDVVYWPSIHNDIRVTVDQCQICQENKPAQQKEPMQSQPIAKSRWSIVSTDLFTYQSKDFIIVVDNLTKFWEVEKLQETSAEETIDKLKAIFARHGIPNLVISDNGPQFVNKEFRKFQEEWDFKHYTSSPHHSEGNGTAEAAVKIAKKLLSRSSDPWLAILEHRNTPMDGYSPAQKLFSRRTRTSIPTKTELLKPQVIPVSELIASDVRKKQQNKLTVDKRRKVLPPLVIGE